MICNGRSISPAHYENYRRTRSIHYVWNGTINRVIFICHDLLISFIHVLIHIKRHWFSPFTLTRRMILAYSDAFMSTAKSAKTCMSSTLLRVRVFVAGIDEAVYRHSSSSARLFEIDQSESMVVLVVGRSSSTSSDAHFYHTMNNLLPVASFLFVSPMSSSIDVCYSVCYLVQFLCTPSLCLSLLRFFAVHRSKLRMKMTGETINIRPWLIENLWVYTPENIKRSQTWAHSYVVSAHCYQRQLAWHTGCSIYFQLYSYERRWRESQGDYQVRNAWIANIEQNRERHHSPSCLRVEFLMFHSLTTDYIISISLS